jgi:uncharacterized repeat protein (TIGR01451 family)
MKLKLHKVLNVIVSLSLLVNSISAPLSIYAQEITPTPEPTPIVEESSSPEPSILPTEEPIVSSTPSEEPTILPSGTPISEQTGTPIPIETFEEGVIAEPSAEILLTPKPEIEKVCLTDGTIKDTESGDWNISDAEGYAETKEKVTLGVKYNFPQENKVSVTFKCLPKDESLRTTLKIQKVKVSDLELSEEINPYGEYAYDITTEMNNGDFEYDVTLPKPDNTPAEVSYMENKGGELKAVEEDKTKQEGSVVKVESLDHFTIFIVMNPDETLVDNSVSSQDDGWVSDNNYARFNNENDSAEYGFPNLGIPSGSAIEGIEVFIEGYTDGRDFDISLWNKSNSNPDAYTSIKLANLGNSENTITLGNSTDKWGKTWIDTDFDTDFKIRVDANSGSGTAYLDMVQVKVYYTASGGFPTLPYNPSDDYALTSVSAIWTSVTGGSNVNGLNTQEVRWGNSTGYGQSGLRFDGSGIQSFNEGNNFYLGALTHFNWPITNAATGAKLKITLQFSKPSVSPNPDFTYDFVIDETPNSSPCNSGWQQSSTPCDDKITFPNSYGTQTFTIGDKIYTLVIDGFVNAFPGGSVVSQFITEEQKNNVAFLVGHISSVLVQRPDIRITKKINNQDISSAPGPSLNVGDTVNWSYIVQNSGNVTLTGITVTDNPSETINCGGQTTLASGATMTCTASGTVQSGAFTNTATVVGTHSTGTVNASDSSWYNGVQQTGTLTVIKHVVNNDGGTKGYSDFSFSVNGAPAIIFESDGQNDLTVNAGTYSITEPSVAGYATTYNNCTNVVISNSGSASCTITNDDVAPTLTLVKSVINNDGGTESGNGWVLYADGSDRPFYNWGPVVGPNQVMAGVEYTLTETDKPGYSASPWRCTGGGTQTGNKITLGLDENVTCTITNDDIAPTLKLVKSISGGTSVAHDWTLSAQSNGAGGFSDWGDSTIFHDINANISYWLSEQGGPAGYTPSLWTCDNGIVVTTSSSITLPLAKNVTCSITNTIQTGTLRVIKTVVDPTENPILDPGNWSIHVKQNGVNVIGSPQAGNSTGTVYTLTPGTYQVIEPAVHILGNTYSLGFSGDCAAVSDYPAHWTTADVTVVAGQEKICHLTNTRTTQTIIVDKEVDTDGNGTFEGSNTVANTLGFLWGYGSETPNRAMGTSLIWGMNLDEYFQVYENAVPGYHYAGYYFEVLYSGPMGSCSNPYSLDYPSLNPLSAEFWVKYTFCNARDTGNLRVQKIVDYGSLTDWSFSLDGGTAIQADANGIVDFGQVTTLDNHTISESGPGTFYLDSISGLNCSPSAVAGITNATVSKGGITTCIFSNKVNKGSITIIKDAIPDNSQDFSFTTSSNLSGFNLDDDFDPVLSNSRIFSNLLPGTYTISEVAVDGWDSSLVICDSTDSNDTLSIGSSVINLSAGENVTCTFTNTQHGSISGHKINDKNLSRSYDSGDEYLSGWTIYIDANINSQLDPGEATDITDVNGDYQLNNLPLGDHRVCEVMQNNWAHSFKICLDLTLSSNTPDLTNIDFYNYAYGYLQITKDLVPDQSGWYNLGYDDLGITTNNNDYDSTPFVIPVGSHTVWETGANGTDLADFQVVFSGDCDSQGNVSIAIGDSKVCHITNTKKGSISGYKWNDINQNGIWDGGEPVVNYSDVVNGVTIYLDLNNNGQQNIGEPSTDTDNNGYYQFANIVSGRYVICERDDNMTGWTRTYPIGNNCHGIFVNPGEDLTNINFGNFENVSVTACKQADPDGLIGTTDGRTNLTGWHVNLMVNGLPTSAQVTEANGCYTWSNLGPGDYGVGEALLPGWTNLTGTTYNFGTVQSGSSNSFTFVNTHLGNMIVKKVMVGGTSSFNFSGDVSGTIDANNGTLQVNNVLPGDYTSYEDPFPVSGWNLTSISCDDSASQSPSDSNVSTGQLVFKVDPGETVTCTFTNTKQSSITVIKDDNLNSGQEFTFDYTPLGSATTQFILDDDNNSDATYSDTQIFSNLSSGFYTINEVATPGWSPSIVECTSNYNLIGFPQYNHWYGTMSTALRAGENLVCTYQNVRDTGTIQIKKNVIPDDSGVTGWDFSIVGPTANTANDLQDNELSGVYTSLTGSYTITESAHSGTDAGYFNSNYLCQVGTTVIASGNPSTVASFNLGVGQNVLCTFNNARIATGLTVMKQADMDGNGTYETNNPATFSWSLDGVSHNWGNQSTYVGSHTITESSPVDYHFTGWYTLPSTQHNCINPEGTSYPITLELPQTSTWLVLCNVHDTGTVILDKVTNPLGDQTDFDLEVYDYTGVIGSGPTVGEGMVSDVDAPVSVTLPTGRYGVRENNPDTEYYLSDTTCVSSVSGTLPNYYDFQLQSNETVNCTFNNLKKGHLIIQKTTNPANDPTQFEVHVLNDSGGSEMFFGPSSGNISDSTDLDVAMVGGPVTVYESYPDFFSLPEGWTQTGQNGCQGISVAAGETKYCTFTNSKLGSISGMKFNDLEADVLGPNEGDTGDPGIENWTIELYRDDGGWQFVTSVQTDSNGVFLFSNLEPGVNYKVAEVMQPGWTPLMPNGQGYYTVSPLQPGQHITKMDFGNVQYGSIALGKCNDINGDGGECDGSEPMLEGWTLFLDENENHILDNEERNGITSSEGMVYFTNVLPRAYGLCEVEQEGWIRTKPSDSNCIDINLAPGGGLAFYFANKEIDLGLTLAKSNSVSGSTVNYSLTLTNTGNQDFTEIVVTDALPGGFSYVLGSSKVDGVTISDPTIVGGAMIWSILDGLLKGTENSKTLTYKANISSDLKNGIYTNLAYALGTFRYGRDYSESKESGLSTSDVAISLGIAYSGTLLPQVLGASTELPGTGSPTIMLVIAILMGLIGVSLKIHERKGKNAKN